MHLRQKPVMEVRRELFDCSCDPKNVSAQSGPIAKVPIRIKRAVREGNYVVSQHCRQELANDGFLIQDAVSAILSSVECDIFTDDESHVRYKLYGQARDDRALNVVVMVHQGTVILKTGYESFS